MPLRTSALPRFASMPFTRVALLALGACLPITAASAQSKFTVTTLTDAATGVAANCSNQVSSTSLDASCSLRDALAAAAAVNSAGGMQPVTVDFAPSIAAVGNPATIKLGASPLALPTYTTLQGLTSGNGIALANLITINANAHVGFTVDSTVTNAAINNLTITGGAPAISNAGTLTVSQSTFTRNSTVSGGAIYNAGTITVTGSTFTGNSATTYGAAIFSTGPVLVGPVVTAVNLTVIGSTFQGNTSSLDGGAIYIGRASVGSIDSTTFTGNFASRQGAALFINNGSGLTRVTNSILTGDTGGSECSGVGCSGTVRAFTFSGSASPTDSGTITLTLTLASGGVIRVPASYGPFSTPGSLASTYGAYISSGGTGLSAQGFGNTVVISANPDSIASAVFDNPSSFVITPVPDSVIAGTGNTVSVTNSLANLSELGSYGGPTQTILPLPGSAALCAITPTAATGTDQRALPRTSSFGSTLCQDSGSVQTNFGLSFTQQPASTTANAILTPAPSVQITESGQKLTRVEAPVDIKDLSGALSGTRSVRSTSGLAVFPNLSVTRTQSANTLTASLAVGANSVSATSQPFDVTPQPTATISGNTTLPLTVLGSTSTRVFTFTNTGTAALSISALQVNSAPEFTQTNTCGLTLAAGANCTITVTFRPIVEGTRRGTFALVSNASGYSQSMSLSGTAAIASAALTGTAAFPSTAIGNTSTAQTFTLTNTSTVALTINAVTATGDFTQTNTCGASLAAGANCTISVLFKPTAGGPRTGKLAVDSNATAAVPSIALTGTGLTLSGTLTGTVAFPAVRVGTASSAQTLTLANTGTGTLTITGIVVTGDFAQTNTCGSSLATGTSCTISVVFTPSATGARTGTLTVTTDATAAIAPLTLSGNGTVAQGALSAAAVFPSTVVAASSPAQPFILSNTGTEPLIIAGIATTGDFSQKNNCGTSLATGATCSIAVVFTPTAPGARTGTLLVTSNARVAIPAATLSGTGTPPPTFTLGDNTSGASSTAISVAAGGTGTGTLKFTSANGFAGSITLACATQGTAPTGAACTVTSPVTLTAGSTATATVTITTTARTMSAGFGLLPHTGWPAYLVLCGLFAVAVGAMRSAARKARAVSLLTLLFAIGVTLTGCAGGKSSTPTTVTNPNGTPAGSYTYTVTATSNGVTATQSIAVTVQ